MNEQKPSREPTPQKEKRPPAEAASSRRRCSAQDSSRYPLRVHERAPFGDVLNLEGKIREGLEEAGLLPGRHRLGPQFSPSKKDPTKESYPGFSAHELLIRDEVSLLVGAKDREERINELARKCAEATRKLPPEDPRIPWLRWRIILMKWLTIRSGSRPTWRRELIDVTGSESASQPPEASWSQPSRPSGSYGGRAGRD